MKKRIVAIMVLTLLFLTQLIGCGNSGTTSTTTSSASTTTSAKTKKFACLIYKNTNEFTMSVGNGAIKRGKELGIDVTVFDAKGDQATQTSQIETIITQGYDGLMVEPATVNGLDEILKDVKAANIPVVTVIQKASDNAMQYISSFVGADHNAAAKVQMQACVDALGGKGNIGIIDGQMGCDGQIIITAGYNEILAKYPDVKIIEEQSGNWVIDEAISVTETWLQKHKDFNAFIGQSDALALGALKACEDAGIKTGPGGVFISGRDAVSDALNAVKDGRMNATIWQGGPEMGSTAVDTLVKVLNGEQVEKEYLMENILITKDNVDKYLAIKAEMSK